jgi:MFS family permease
VVHLRREGPTVLTSSKLHSDVIDPRNPLHTVAILSASSLTLLALGAVSPSLPAIQRAYTDVPYAALLARSVLRITALSMALSALLSGILVDKVERKPVMLVALVLHLVSGTAGI